MSLCGRPAVERLPLRYMIADLSKEKLRQHRRKDITMLYYSAGLYLLQVVRRAFYR